jgi:hypothetical protein
MDVKENIDDKKEAHERVVFRIKSTAQNKARKSCGINRKTITSIQAVFVNFMKVAYKC